MIVLDTHIWLWWMNGDVTLPGQDKANQIDMCDSVAVSAFGFNAEVWLLEGMTMEAIREFTQLENDILTLRLPLSFKGKRVEVIVMPAQELEATVANQVEEVRRKPSPKLKGTRIIGDIMSPAVPVDDWDALR
ncbi:MAG: hypothetical protein HOP04_03975 [Methylophilaceae bacterium]|nr:hypothetical protein [Methylophilaceae bacterium]